MAKWAPRIGIRGARWFAVAVWSRFLMLPFGFLLLLALALTAKRSEPWSEVLPAVVAAVAFLNATLIWFAPLMARRAATRALGIKVTNANYPPDEEDSYVGVVQTEPHRTQSGRTNTGRLTLSPVPSSRPTEAVTAP